MVAGSGHGSAFKGSTIDLEVTGCGPVGCCFSFPSSFFTMCSSLPCLSVFLMLARIGARVRLHPNLPIF